MSNMREQFKKIIKECPEAWEYIQNEYGCCPPDLQEQSDDDREVRCFNGCSLCWSEYLEGKE